MIQRIQSLWLLLSALAIALLYKFPVYVGELADGTRQDLMVNGRFILMIITTLTMLIPLIAIFLFKNRSTQKQLIWLHGLMCFVLTILIWMAKDKFSAGGNFVSEQFKLASVLPVISLILSVMAYSGIRRDEKLIRDAEKLR